METFTKRFSFGEIPSRLEIDVEDYATVLVQFAGGSVAATGFAAAFEGSLNSLSKESGVWSAQSGQRSNDLSIVNSQAALSLGIGASPNYSILFNVAALKRFRVRATAITAGNIDVIITASKVPASFQPTLSQGISSLTPGTAAGNLGKAEDNAHASGDTGVAILGVRVGANPGITTSATGDYTTPAFTSEGKQVIAGSGAEEHTWRGKIDLTGATDVVIKAAAGAGLCIYVTDIIYNNTGTAVARVHLKDGSTSVLTTDVPANSSVHFPLRTPIKGTANTLLQAILSAAGTVGVVALGYIGV